jgi:hypothetical protein
MKLFLLAVSTLSLSNSLYAASMKVDLMTIVASVDAEKECEARCNWMEQEVKSRDSSFSSYTNLICEVRKTVEENEGGTGLSLGKTCVLTGIKKL